MGKLSDEFKNIQPLALKTAKIILILYYPISLIHESGHALVCTSVNGTFSWVDFMLLAVRCSSIPTESYMMYWALGGIFGMIVSSMFLVFKKIRKNTPFLIAVLTIMFSNFVMFLFETFAHTAYLHSPIAGILMASSIAIFLLILLRFFTPRTKSKS